MKLAFANGRIQIAERLLLETNELETNEMDEEEEFEFDNVFFCLSFFLSLFKLFFDSMRSRLLCFSTLVLAD